MSRRSAEVEENHWPGFVDALSTIVMVVTFLLIILAVVISVLAQNISAQFASSDSTSIGGFESPEKNESKVKPVIEADTKKIITSDTANPDGEFKPEKSTAVKTLETVEGNDKLSIPSEKVSEKDERIEIAKQEQIVNNAAKIVTTTSTALTLVFDETSIKIDENSSTKIDEFLTSNSNLADAESVTIWSFIGSQESGISQSKRIAYYRSLAARNKLLQNGLGRDKVKVEIRFSDDKDIINTVKITINSKQAS